LNGGFKKWVKEGRKTESGQANFEKLEKDGDYNYSIFDESKIVRNVNDMHKIAAKVVNQKTDRQIVDARPAPRFRGEVDEPRAGLRKGHITGSKNVFFNELIDKE
jgi:thiosulfate/3-mercaptopyruvate sulfurtransferase